MSKQLAELFAKHPWVRQAKLLEVKGVRRANSFGRLATVLGWMEEEQRGYKGGGLTTENENEPFRAQTGSG